jgi:uncharacterized protein YkwD
MLLISIGIVELPPGQHIAVAQAAAVQPVQTPHWVSRPVSWQVVLPARSLSNDLQQVAANAHVRPVALRPHRATTARPSAASGLTQVTIGTGQWGLINQDRASAGLPPLQWNTCLANVAIGQAQRMAAQGYISHANGRTLDLGCHLGNFASESIGVQGGGINDAAMNAWFMGDPIHRANIMGPYHWVGSAWVVAPNGAAYLAVEFG